MKLTDDDKICLHHIGGRGGSRSFPINKFFESDIINVLYDADQDCIDQIKESNDKLESSLTVYPHCISDQKKSVKFNISYDPNLSSFLEANDSKENYYYFSKKGGYDYLFNEVSKPVKTLQLETTSLDILKSELGIDFKTPDFLSLDTQGSELEILNGSIESIDSTLGILLETEFVEFYKQQPCYDEVYQFMKSQGFQFIKFTDLQEQKLYRYPMELRSQGFTTDGDALFLRLPSQLNKPSLDNYSSYYKLAYIYISFNMLEPALECLKIINSKWGLQEKAGYYSFLNGLYEISKQYTQYPKTYTDIYTKEKSLARYKPSPSAPSPFKSKLKNLGPVSDILKFTLNTIRKARTLTNNSIKTISIMQKCRKNKIEKYLESHGFIKLSKEVRKNRKSYYKSQ